MNSPRKQNIIEKTFEFLLWHSKIMTIPAVIAGVAGSFALFIMGTYEIYYAVTHLSSALHDSGGYEKIVIALIGAVDLYLIGVVILLFSFGIYELFISAIDIARIDKDLSILEIHSLDELKNKLLKVITMVMIVSFFKIILSMKFETPTDILYLSLSILAISIAAYLIRKKEGT